MTRRIIDHITYNTDTAIKLIEYKGYSLYLGRHGLAFYTYANPDIENCPRQLHLLEDRHTMDYETNRWFPTFLDIVGIDTEKFIRISGMSQSEFNNLMNDIIGFLQATEMEERITLRMPVLLHTNLKARAKAKGMSLNKYIIRKLE